MRIYVVKPGDTLGNIAAAFGVSVNELIDINSLENPNQLVVGQALIIPSPPVIHVVRPGETLWQIARKYGVTIRSITDANHITDPSNIYAGQKLIIPSPSVRVHTVSRGETLWQIARMYGSSVPAIVRYNQLANPAQLYPGQILYIPKRAIEVNGYLAKTGTSGVPIANSVAPYLTYLSLFSYHILEDGSLLPIDDIRELQAANNNHAAPLMVITNFAGRKFSPELAHSVLSSPAARQNLISNVLNTMKNKGYMGLNIDFEYVRPADRERYNSFLLQVVQSLRPQGYLVSTALAPKETATQAGLLYEAHDYPVHGRLTDFVVLMTYEWGYASGPPWAIAPLNKVRDVLDYAVTAIPPSKILMGMPLYGRDWKLPYVAGRTIAETISPPEAVARAAKYGARIQFHPVYQSPYYRYTDEQGADHEVWFEDARSMQKKYELVAEYNLRGVSYWELSSPFPQNWVVLTDMYNVKKMV